ncbi:c-type cytochrome [Geobacter sulfurreducens]|jgi:mono/diheme cytochrome c family protein|uniref:c-type cytochrome n=1 Tax=Geobacter sulfurreducens TaxID=35554 RepID=UPI0001D8F23B|nr:c-type cytochrome [Geobacter sulfurreducens]ADI85272.1 lipoprotein cytochrome c, 1 heme-binding site [Geobacter sulfurreducens KN400]AJY68747.1 cytochrome C [Geobacter sulfurreducens]QVW34341.1 c-type cytochrome [Geobacter sulfurreducens]
MISKAISAQRRHLHRAAVLVAMMSALAATGCSKKEAPQAPAPSAGAPQTGAPAAMPEGMSGQQQTAMGRAIFNKRCASCHGTDGNGAGSRSGPALDQAQFKYGRTPEAIKESIAKGRPNGMPAFGSAFQEIEIDTLVGFVLSLHKQ